MSIGPFGANDADRRHRENLEIVLKEAFKSEYDYKPFSVVPKMDMASDIFGALITADLVVADLRGLNPNVMYELGIRHAFNRPIIHMIDEFTEAPWDVDKNFMVVYPLPLQISHKDELIAKVLERVQRVGQIKNEKEGSYNTFHSHYKKVAAVAQFHGSPDVKALVELITAQYDSLVSRIESSAMEARRADRYAGILGLPISELTPQRMNDDFANAWAAIRRRQEKLNKEKKDSNETE